MYSPTLLLIFFHLLLKKYSRIKKMQFDIEVSPPANIMSLSFTLTLRPLSLYCLVDEVLRHGKIMPDEKKNLTLHSFFIFSSDMHKNQRIFFQKLHKSIWNLLIFNRKSNFPIFFSIFSSDQNPNPNFYFYFFSSGKVLITLVGARRPNNIVRVALCKAVPEI